MIPGKSRRTMGDKRFRDNIFQPDEIRRSTISLMNNEFKDRKDKRSGSIATEDDLGRYISSFD